MTNYFFAGIIAFLISLILTFFVKKIAIKNLWTLTAPRERDLHKKPIPRLGGIAVFVSFWLLVTCYLLLVPDRLHFVDEKILGIDKNLLGVFLGSLILLVTGIYDDFKDIKPWIKLLLQLVAAVVIVFFGIKIWWLSNPLGGSNIVLNTWTYVLVPVWILLVVNVINWLDGLDGLADGVSVITLIIIAILSATSTVNQPATALICSIAAGSALGFLPFNFFPAKIFLGDTGSMFLGFIIAVGAIISGGKIATAALVLGIPILDAIWVIFRRIFSGNSPMKADRYHLHHRFLQAGFSQKQTVMFLYLIAISFGIIALQNGTRGKFEASLWLLVIMFIMGLGLIFLKRGRKNV